MAQALFGYTQANRKDKSEKSLRGRIRFSNAFIENAEIEEAIDAIDADDSHVFHVNDLQAKGVTQ